MLNSVEATHDILSRILPRCDKDVGPGQRQQQSQRNHINLKVPNNDDEDLLGHTHRNRAVGEKVQWEYTYLMPPDGV